MKIKPQIVIIHGGMTFKNKKDYLRFLKTRPISLEKRESWTGNYLDKKLGKQYEIIRPMMPLKDDSKYQEWKIHFERYIPLLRKNLTLVGYSLGGIFLAQYLSENKFPKKILATYMIAPPFDDTIKGEDLVGGFKLKADLSLIKKNSPNTHLMFSKDDDVVPISHAEKYRAQLKDTDIIIYESKNGHFNVSEFPEIVKMMKADLKKI